MPVHIDELRSEVTVLAEDFALSDRQLEIIVQKVMHRLRKSGRSDDRGPALTAVRMRAQPPARSRG